MQLAELSLERTVTMPEDVPVADTKRLVRDLFHRPRRHGENGLVAWVVTIGVHALVAGTAVYGHHAAAHVERPPVELELTRPEPPLPIHPTPELPAPKSTPAPAAPARAAHVAAAPPPAAQAGALHTAKEDPAEPPKADDPLDFTHVQSVTGFGGGVVAIGGKARFGAPGAAAVAPSSAPVRPAPAASGETLVDPADLGRKPSLSESDPCRGYFPGDATVDEGSASVLVVIAKSGAVSKATLLNEAPGAQGFGSAARTCMSHKHFTPALDREGQPAATAIRVNVHFTR